MAEYKLREQATQRIRQGGALILVEDFVNQDKAQYLQEGDVIILQDSHKDFLGKFLVGRQNKGLGWIFTQSEYEYWDQELIEDRFREAVANRTHLFEDSQTTAFRLFNGEGDGIGGITIDWYANYLQINFYSYGVYKYLDEILSSLNNLSLDIRGVYVTLRFKHDEEESIFLVQGEHAPQPLTIKENGINYAVYLGEDWMTGIFLDQREVRDFIRQQGHGLSFLNLFSYTGAFSVAGAVGGALKTVSVDVANRSLERTKEQFQINEITPEQTTHEIRVMDVFDYLNYAQRHDLKFDLIVCDPPSFARTKKRTFAAEQDYRTLAEQIFQRVEMGGYAILSTNHSGYSLEQFRQDMIQATHSIPGQYHLIQQFGLPEDFPTTIDSVSQYLKVLVFYRQE